MIHFQKIPLAQCVPTERVVVLGGFVATHKMFLRNMGFVALDKMISKYKLRHHCFSGLGQHNTQPDYDVRLPPELPIVRLPPDLPDVRLPPDYDVRLPPDLPVVCCDT